MADPVKKKAPVKKAAKKAAPVKKAVQKRAAPLKASPTPEELEAKATELQERGEAMEDVIFETMVNDNNQLKRQNKVLISGIAVILLLTAVAQYRAFFVSGPILSKLDRQGEDVGKLVGFVDSIDAQACDGTDCPPSDTEKLLGNFITILCASKDPGQIQACVELGYKPNPGG